MSHFRALAHLEQQLGPDLFRVLLDSGNTGRVKVFCGGLLAEALPTTMTVGDRTYRILGFLHEDEKSVSVDGATMVARAKEMEAHLGRNDGEYLLARQDEIPPVLRDKVAFVFTDWRHPDYPGDVAYLYWYGGRWIQDWDGIDVDWNGGIYRVLRRHRTRA